MTCFPEHDDKTDFSIHPEQERSVCVLPGCLTHSLLGRGRLLLGLLSYSNPSLPATGMGNEANLHTFLITASPHSGEMVQVGESCGVFFQTTLVFLILSGKKPNHLLKSY